MPLNKEKEQSTLNGLDQYNTCRLEFDGLTRVLSHVLSKEAIEHTAMVGEITNQKTHQSFAPHFCIVLPDRRHIDYRAQMWLGEADYIAHGIFNVMITSNLQPASQNCAGCRQSISYCSKIVWLHQPTDKTHDPKNLEY